jgi:hypothetical protein
MLSQSPLVYIIILGWNNATNVIECLESLRQLDYPNCRVVVVDNGSADNTVAIVRERFAEVHVIENRVNLGYAEGNNVGIRYALSNNANYLFILNDDTTVEPDVLTQLVRVGEADPQIGMLGPSVVSYVSRSREYIGATINWHDGTTAYGSAALPQTGDVDYLAGCALMVKAQVAREIGLLDVAYFCYFEDADWGMRCHRAGYRVVAVPRAKIYHKGTPDNLRHESPELLFFYSRNEYLFMRRYADWFKWLPFFLCYTRRCCLQYYGLVRQAEWDKADAVIAGFWAGITRQYGAQRVQAPKLVKSFIYGTGSALALFLRPFRSRWGEETDTTIRQFPKR